MKNFPITILGEIRTVFSGGSSSRRTQRPVCKSIRFGDQNTRETIDVELVYPGDRHVVVTLSAEDFFEDMPEIPGRVSFSKIAHQISLLALEWLYGREDEVGFPRHVYLRYPKWDRIERIQVRIEVDIPEWEDREVHYVVLLNGQKIGLLLGGHLNAQFPVSEGYNKLRIAMDGQFYSDEVSFAFEGGRVRGFVCHIRGDSRAPLVKLVQHPLLWGGPRGYPRSLSRSSTEERAAVNRRLRSQTKAIVALREAEVTLSGANVDLNLQSAGWSRPLAHELAEECSRLRLLLEESDRQLTREFGDLGLERWLRAYVPSAAGDRLQDAVLRASGALKALTAAGDE